VEATVTDANLVLGYMDGSLGGVDGITLDAAAAHDAVAALASKSGMDTEATACGIRRVANAEMVKALRVISVERGHDPRNFVLVAFGGAGPMHGADLADELGMKRVLIPDSCGVLSALGMVVGDERRDWVKTVSAPLDWDDEFLARSFQSFEADVADGLTGTRVSRQAELRYRGQSHELTVACDTLTRDDVVVAFHQAHEQGFGYYAGDEPVELVNIRLTALRPLEQPRLMVVPGQPSDPVLRRAYFGDEWLDALVYQRQSMAAEVVAGPAVIEEAEATTVVPPGWQAHIDGAGNLWLERPA
jgi:N-methylhydantoinase A